MKKLTLDLHDIYNKHREIEKALREVLEEAREKKVGQNMIFEERRADLYELG